MKYTIHFLDGTTVDVYGYNWQNANQWVYFWFDESQERHGGAPFRNIKYIAPKL